MEHVNEYHVLINRSEGFLMMAEEALKKRAYDLACFFSEQAVQLFIKAELLRVIGDYPRTHHVRFLMSKLLEVLTGEKRKGLEEYVRVSRAKLSELEDAYLMSRYTTKTYTREDAEDIIDLAKELISKVKEVMR